MNDKNHTSDTPLTLQDGDWYLEIPAGRKVICATTFDQDFGYSMLIAFDDGKGVNILNVEMARVLSKAIRERVEEVERAGGSSGDSASAADFIDEASAECEHLNEIWIAAGKPAGGFEAQPAGHA
jgi:hypothetical protein